MKLATPCLFVLPSLALGLVAAWHTTPRAGANPVPIRTTSFVEDYELIEQLSAFNPPGNDPWTEDDAVGFACGCSTPGNSASRAATWMDLGSGDRVLLHSGQAVHEATDLSIPGRDTGINLQITRRHTTRVDETRSPFGPAWSFNYGHWVRQKDGTDDLIFHGFGREDLFTYNSEQSSSDATYAWYDGGMGRLERARLNESTGELVVYRRGGATMTFMTEVQSSLIEGVLEKIESPKFNSIEFAYTGGGALISQKLSAITESYGRTITFNYAGGADYVTSIVDFDGRTTTYSYDGDDALTSVTYPTISGTGLTGDFSGTPTVTYTYVKHGSVTPLFYALESVVAPNQNGTALTVLEWTYYDNPTTEASVLGFVETHAVGNTSGAAVSAGIDAGGTYSYSYAAHGSAIGMSPWGGMNDETIVTTVTDRRGTETDYTLNRFGQVLEERISPQSRPLRPGATSDWVRAFTYNDDGLAETIVLPLGNDRTLTYPAAPKSRFAAGNVLSIVDEPDGTRTANQASLTTTYDYEPVFQKVFKVTEPRGNDGSNDPADYTTKFFYSYMEDLDAAKVAFAPRLNLSTTGGAYPPGTYTDESALAQEFSDRGLYVDADADLNGDSSTSQTCSLHIKVVYPDATIPAVSSGSIALTTMQASDEIYVYNSFHQRIKHRDAEQNVHEWEYYGEEDIDGDGATEVTVGGGASATAGGFLKSYSRDTTSAAGRNNGVNSTPVDAMVTYEYKAQTPLSLGETIPENERGVPTAVIDARGVTTAFWINERDQVVSTWRAAAVPGGGGLTAYKYRSNSIYDANGNVVATEIENKDGVSSPNDFIRSESKHDILNHVVSTIADVEPASPIMGQKYLEIESTYDYDASEQQIQVVRAAGETEETTEEWALDELGIVVTHTRGVGETEESEVATEIDLNGNIVTFIDADGADETEYEFDGYDRLLATTDRMGTKATNVYDHASNVVEVEVIGQIDVFLESDITLSQTQYHYDERGRRYRSDERLLHYGSYTVGTLTDASDGALNDGDGSNLWVVDLSVYDRLGRIVKRIDPDSDEFKTDYDGLGRVLSTRDAMLDTSSIDYKYDVNGNVLSRTSVEDSSEITSTESFETQFVYDALNRKVATIEPITANVSEMGYDSRGNVIRTTDQLDNEVEYGFDRLSRAIASRRYLSSTGGGATASSKDTAQGLDNWGQGGGHIGSTTIWDALGRRVEVRDDGFNAAEDGTTSGVDSGDRYRTIYEYDALDRVTGVIYGDGSASSWEYNDDSELTSHTTQQGAVLDYTLDAEGRVLEIDVDLGSLTEDTEVDAGFTTYPDVEIRGTTYKRYTWDGLGRMWGQCDHNQAASGDEVTIVYWHDSLGRVIREGQNVSSGGSYVDETDLEWVGRSRLVSMTYPTMYDTTGSMPYPSERRTVTLSYDANDRVHEVRENGGALISETLYVGPRRLVRRDFASNVSMSMLANGGAGSQTTSGTDPCYDANGRVILQSWKDSSLNLLTEYELTYNAAGSVMTESRNHFTSAHVDTYVRDSAQRALEFERNGSIDSERTLSGAGSMLAFDDEGVDRIPVVDGYDHGTPSGEPDVDYAAEYGRHQYSEFDGGERIYNDMGNLVADESGKVYEYDAFGRLVYVWAGEPFASTLEAWYTYDAQDRRVFTLFPGPVVEQYIFGGARSVIQDKNFLQPVPKRDYVRSEGTAGELLQMRRYDSSSDPSISRDFSYHGSPRGSMGGVSSDGAIEEYYEYSWLGELDVLDEDGDPVTPNVSVVGSPWGYGGLRLDAASGWWWDQNTLYDPRVGDRIETVAKGEWHMGESVVVGISQSPSAASRLFKKSVDLHAPANPVGGKGGAGSKHIMTTTFIISYACGVGGLTSYHHKPQERKMNKAWWMANEGVIETGAWLVLVSSDKWERLHSMGVDAKDFSMRFEIEKLLGQGQSIVDAWDRLGERKPRRRKGALGGLLATTVLHGGLGEKLRERQGDLVGLAGEIASAGSDVRGHKKGWAVHAKCTGIEELGYSISIDAKEIMDSRHGNWSGVDFGGVDVGADAVGPSWGDLK